MKGVIYLPSIPAAMRHTTLRRYFSEFGNIERIYLRPESDTKKAHRRREGGSSQTQFKDGWVEFEDASIAKRVALQLNGTPVAKKNSDLWTIKYLPEFSWDDLVQTLASESHVRDTRRRAELASAKHEANAFREASEKAKKLRKISERTGMQFRERTFKQRADFSDRQVEEKPAPSASLIAMLVGNKRPRDES